MALQVVDVQLFIDGVWTTYAAFDAEGWSTRIGPDIQQGLTPNKIEFTLTNDDLSMDPTNVSSALYGKIGRNTRARLRVNTAVITWAEASSWKPDRTLEHVAGLGRGRSTMAVVAEGLLRRLGRWEDPLDSPMRRFISSSYSSLTGHWPLEDPSGSARLAQMVAGARQGTYSGTLTLAGNDGAGGSDPCLTVGADARIDGRFKMPSASGWQVSYCMKLAVAPASAAFNVLFVVVDTLNRTWSWQASNTTMRVAITDADGTLLKTADASYGTLALTQWICYRLKVTVSGGTITLEPAWFIQDGSVLTGYTDTFAASSTGQARDWRITGNSYVDGAAYAHVFGTSDSTLDLLSAQAVDAFDGFSGERAADRWSRLMLENGLTRYIVGTASKSMPMGRQKSGKLLDLLEQCRITDDALLYDEPLDIAMTFRCNSALTNQTPALALTYGVDVSPPLTKLIDDLRVTNDVTATNWDGTQVRVQLDSGTLSTAAPPDGVGRYRLPLDVCTLGVDQLEDRAAWELNRGTLDRPRYDSIVVDLLAFPSYRAAITAMRPGDWITLAGIEPDTVNLMVLSVERQGDAARDTATLNCVPADVYRVLKAGTAGHLAGSATTMLVGSLTTTGTSVKIGTLNPKDVWSTTTPYDIKVSGERMTVSAMTATTSDATLSANGFEAGTGGWTATSCTLAQSSTFANSGTFSGLLTVTGSPVEAFIRKSLTQSPRVIPGQEYTLSIWVRSTALLSSVSCHVEWLDSSGAFLSRSGTSGSLASGSWVNRVVTANAPTGAAYASYGATIGGSPTAGTVLYTDDLLLTATMIKYQTMTLTRSVNAVVKAQVPGAAVDVFSPVRFGL